MLQEIVCYHCGRQFNCHEAIADGAVPCPKCGELVDLSRAERAAPSDYLSEVPLPKPEPVMPAESAPDGPGKPAPFPWRSLVPVWKEKDADKAIILGVVIFFLVVATAAGVDFTPLIGAVYIVVASLFGLASILAVLWSMPNYAYRFALATAIAATFCPQPWATTAALACAVFISTGLILQAIERLQLRSVEA
jgi:predicted RNA-binding Zn-ribbon protein involved in translation (DUF1610 family)